MSLVSAFSCLYLRSNLNDFSLRKQGLRANCSASDIFSSSQDIDKNNKMYTLFIGKANALLPYLCCNATNIKCHSLETVQVICPFIPLPIKPWINKLHITSWNPVAYNTAVKCNRSSGSLEDYLFFPNQKACGARAQSVGQKVRPVLRYIHKCFFSLLLLSIELLLMDYLDVATFS